MSFWQKPRFERVVLAETAFWACRFSRNSVLSVSFEQKQHFERVVLAETGF
jgi:hypothetical protein